MKKILFCLGVLVVSSVASAWAAHEHRLTTYLNASTNGCEQEAKGYATQLAKASGVFIKSSKCISVETVSDSNKNYSVYFIEVLYRASSAIQLNSAVFGKPGFGQMPSKEVGMYPTMASCLSDISKQKQLFVERAGLQPLRLYCEKGILHPSVIGFVLNIEYFGKPYQELFAVEHSKYQKDTQLRNALVKLIEKNFGKVVLVNGDTVLYYAKEPVAATVNSFGFFDNLKECEVQINDVKRMYAVRGEKVEFIQCGAVEIGEENFSGVKELRALGDVSLMFSEDFGQDVPPYMSFQTCMADKANVVKSRQNNYSKPLGGICNKNSIFDERVYLHLFYKL